MTHILLSLTPSEAEEFAHTHKHGVGTKDNVLIVCPDVVVSNTLAEHAQRVHTISNTMAQTPPLHFSRLWNKLDPVQRYI